MWKILLCRFKSLLPSPVFALWTKKTLGKSEKGREERRDPLLPFLHSPSSLRVKERMEGERERQALEEFNFYEPLDTLSNEGSRMYDVNSS